MHRTFRRSLFKDEIQEITRPIVNPFLSGNALRILNPAQNFVYTTPESEINGPIPGENQSEKNGPVPTEPTPESANTNIDETPEATSDFLKKIQAKAAELSKSLQAVRESTSSTMEAPENRTLPFLSQAATETLISEPPKGTSSKPSSEGIQVMSSDELEKPSGQIDVKKQEVPQPSPSPQQAKQSKKKEKKKAQKVGGSSKTLDTIMEAPPIPAPPSESAPSSSSQPTQPPATEPSAPQANKKKEKKKKEPKKKKSKGKGKGKHKLEVSPPPSPPPPPPPPPPSLPPAQLSAAQSSTITTQPSTVQPSTKESKKKDQKKNESKLKKESNQEKVVEEESGTKKVLEVPLPTSPLVPPQPESPPPASLYESIDDVAPLKMSFSEELLKKFGSMGSLIEKPADSAGNDITTTETGTKEHVYTTVKKNKNKKPADSAGNAAAAAAAATTTTTANATTKAVEPVYATVNKKNTGRGTESKKAEKPADATEAADPPTPTTSTTTTTTTTTEAVYATVIKKSIQSQPTSLFNGKQAVAPNNPNTKTPDPTNDTHQTGLKSPTPKPASNGNTSEKQGNKAKPLSFGDNSDNRNIESQGSEEPIENIYDTPVDALKPLPASLKPKHDNFSSLHYAISELKAIADLKPGIFEGGSPQYTTPEQPKKKATGSKPGLKKQAASDSSILIKGGVAHEYSILEPPTNTKEKPTLSERGGEKAESMKAQDHVYDTLEPMYTKSTPKEKKPMKSSKSVPDITGSAKSDLSEKYNTAVQERNAAAGKVLEEENATSKDTLKEKATTGLGHEYAILEAPHNNTANTQQTGHQK